MPNGKKEGETVSGEAIAKVRAAEENAIMIKNVAAGEASDALSEAKRLAAEYQTEIEEKALRVMNERIETAKLKAENYIKDEKNKALRESGQIVKNAHYSMPDAVRQIVMGVIEKWQ